MFLSANKFISMFCKIQLLLIIVRFSTNIFVQLKGEFIYMTYKTHGTCSSKIDLDIDSDHIIKSVKFTGGCNGNLKGISNLVTGKKAEDVISDLEGIRCGFKATSCPDQLTKALRQAIEEQG